jgi:hypothetical protein
VKQSRPLPAPNSDFYKSVETLPAEELAIVKKVRAYMEANVAPIINKYWVEDSFPLASLHAPARTRPCSTPVADRSPTDVLRGPAHFPGDVTCLCPSRPGS